MTPVYSIIIPVYNGEKYIKYALDSCVNQSYNDIEIIVIDDGSTDKTSEIVKQYQEKHNNLLLIEQENAGVSCARNKGLENASGEWICFLDADDELFTDAVESLLVISRMHNADIVVGNHITISNRKKENMVEHSNKIVIWENNEGLEKYLVDAPELYSACGKLYSSAIIKEIRFAEGHKVHEDSFFNFLCCLKKPKIAITGNVYYKVFLSENSASRSFFTNQKYNDILYFTEEKSRIIKEKFPEYLDKLYNVIIKSRMVFLWNTDSRFDLEAKEIQKEAKKTIKKYKKYFVPATKQDKKMFFLVQYNLYGLYKIIKKIKRSF